MCASMLVCLLWWALQGTSKLSKSGWTWISQSTDSQTSSVRFERPMSLTLWLCPSPPDQMQGTVTLRNISTSTSGLYQCTSSNTIGKSTCVLNLQVVARKSTENKVVPVCLRGDILERNRRATLSQHWKVKGSLLNLYVLVSLETNK